MASPTNQSSQQQKLEESQERTRFFQVAAMRPDLQPAQTKALQHLEQSQRAETSLRQKALQYDQAPELEVHDPAAPSE
jgi:hypothetical protein